MVIGVGCFLLLKHLVEQLEELEYRDENTIIFNMLPEFIISFLVYGPLVLLCNKLMLVKQVKSNETKPGLMNSHSH